MEKRGGVGNSFQNLLDTRTVVFFERVPMLLLETMLNGGGGRGVYSNHTWPRCWDLDGSGVRNFRMLGLEGIPRARKKTDSLP